MNLKRPSRGLSFALTEQEKLRRDISTLKALIRFYVDHLDGRLLSADERRVIKDRLDTLISELQRLMQRRD
jgi:hypothetical protein